MSHSGAGFNAPPSTMRQRSHDRTSDVVRLRGLLSSDRFAYGGKYGNLHSSLCGEAELARFLDPAAAGQCDDHVPSSGNTWDVD